MLYMFNDDCGFRFNMKMFIFWLKAIALVDYQELIIESNLIIKCY